MKFTKHNNTLAPGDRATELWLDKQPDTIHLKEISKKDVRTLSQNRLAWMWYGQIGYELGISPQEAHCYCKLTYGVPILCAASDKFAEMWGRVSKATSHEDQLRLIEAVDVTSAFNVKQAKEYLDTVFRSMAQKGIMLTDPNARFYE